MATIPLWLLGKHLTALNIYPQTVSTAGVLSDAATSALLTQSDSIQLSLSPSTENITAVNVPRANSVIVEDDASLNVSIIEVNNTSDPSKLGTYVGTYDYYKVVFTKGNATGSTATWTGYFTRGEYSEGVSGKGKQIASLQLHVCDVGSAAVAKSLA